MGSALPKFGETRLSKKAGTKIKTSSNTKTPSRWYRSRNVENFIIIWLDSEISESNKDTKNSVNHFRQIINSIRIFNISDQCIDFLTDMKSDKVFLITSGSIGQKLISVIEDLNQLNSIYIYSKHKSKHEQWRNHPRKIRGIFTDLLHICDALKQDVLQCDTDLIPISIFSNTSSTNLDELEPSFMYSQLLEEILLELEHDDKAKKELVDFCRQQYLDNDVELKVIDEFDRDYNKSTPI